MHPSINELRSLLIYDGETGVLTWSENAHPGKKGWRAGKLYASSNGRQYRRVIINGRQFMEHQVAFALARGEWSSSVVDHINGIGTDNRLSNLREATTSENNRNSRIRSDNSTGFKGVSRQGRRFRAYIKSGDRQRNLGVYDTPEAAHAAYVAAANELFGEFARAA